MDVRLSPYLNFAGNARDAMEFYQSVIGGELAVNTFGEFGTPEGTQADQIMHAQLLSDSLTLMGADIPEGMDLAPNGTVSLFGDDAAWLKAAWDKLADGATVQMPLEKQIWGDEFGLLVDRFGVQWMVNIGGASS